MIAVYFSLPNDLGTYAKKMETFAALEEEALQVIQQDPTTDEALKLLDEKGIKNWQRIQEVLNDISTLDLPHEVHQRNAALMRYADLRLEFYELYYKALVEETAVYDEQLDSINTMVVSIVDSLNNATKQQE